MTVSARDAVDAANAAFGRHPGHRALHARGVLCTGTFTSLPAAAELTRAAHMQGVTVPATYRLSNGSGNPRQPDWMPDPRGLAAKFYLPDGSRTDLVAVSSPVFAASTPDAFVELLRAQAAGPAALVKLPRVLAAQPGMLMALARDAPSLRPPASYAQIPYYGQHAFRWLAADGSERHVRYFLAPEAGTRHLAPWRARRLGAEYLQEELRHRLADGPIRFTLSVQIATPGDPVADPSRPWPSSRRRVEVGRYELTGLETSRERDGDVLVFDPTRVTDGIECSEDPVLRFRRDAYSESVARRTS